MKLFKQWSVDPHEKIIMTVIHVFFHIFVRDETDAQESLLEAYRLLKSTAYQLYHVMQQNHVLQDLVTFYISHGVSQGEEI